MKKLIITGLVLGLSSTAFADHPTPAAKPLPYSHTMQRADHDNANHGRFAGGPAGGIDRDRRMPPAMLQWKTLEASKKISNKQTINIGGREAFSRLKLEAARGSTFIDKVVIVFGNGMRQVVDLDKTLANREAPLFIDLDGKNRRVTKVVVYGKSGRRAAINLLAA
jgi:hypothetical protein